MKTRLLGDVKITKDVIALIDTLPDGKEITKYFDENQNCLGFLRDDGKVIPTIELADNIGFSNELEAISKNKGVSLEDLEELDKKLEKVARVLGVSKSDIRQMSVEELDSIIENKGDAGISLDDENSSEEKTKQNQKALQGLGQASKQEINLNKKVDTKHTLAEILGVQAGSKLIVVYSDKIKDNENTTRFSCLIEGPDGELSPADMLKQTGGKHSDKNVHEVNNDGSKVSEVNTQSSYYIDSAYIENAVINIRFDTMGEIAVNFGQTDKTSHRDAFTQRLETDRTYPVRRNVQREFDERNGRDNIQEKMDEIEEHEKHGCDNLSLAEADGNPNTRTYSRRRCRRKNYAR